MPQNDQIRKELDTGRDRQHPGFSWPRFQFRLDPELASLFRLYSSTMGIAQGKILRAILLRHLRLVYGHGRSADDVREAVGALNPDDAERYVVGVRADFEKMLRGERLAEDREDYASR